MTLQSGSTIQNSRQMQGEIPAADAFNIVAPPICLRERTPYTALWIEQDMLKGLRTLIRPVYQENKTPMIVMCGYGASLEPPCRQPTVRATSAVNNYMGLQIILCRVNDEDLRRDGVPYHMILSSNPDFADYNILDSDYAWPVTEIGEPHVEMHQGQLCLFFKHVTTTLTPYERVISAADKRAEDLAMRAYYQENENGFSTQVIALDKVPLNVEIGLQRPARTPPVVRVDYSDGRRIAAPIVW